MPLSDILSCPLEEVEACVTSEDPYSVGAWFMAKNIGMIELCQLGEMLGVDSYDALTDGFDLVGEPLDDGPWPQTIPASLTDKLQALTDAEITNASQQWVEIEEFDGMATVESLADYLNRLREFLAANQGPFFLVNSL